MFDTYLRISIYKLILFNCMYFFIFIIHYTFILCNHFINRPSLIMNKFLQSCLLILHLIIFLLDHKSWKIMLFQVHLSLVLKPHLLRKLIELILCMFYLWKVLSYRFSKVNQWIQQIFS